MENIISRIEYEISRLKSQIDICKLKAVPVNYLLIELGVYEDVLKIVKEEAM